MQITSAEISKYLEEAMEWLEYAFETVEYKGCMEEQNMSLL